MLVSEPTKTKQPKFKSNQSLFVPMAIQFPNQTYRGRISRRRREGRRRELAAGARRVVRSFKQEETT